MGQGISGAIIEQHATGEKEGDFLKVSVDFVLLHDPLFALILPELNQFEKGIWDKKKVLVTVDHFAPPSTIERANIVRDVLNYVNTQQIRNCLVYQGICHQLLVEGNWVNPGMIVLGTDSHTTTAGALGCLATGMGSTDILYTLVTGKAWLRTPNAVRVNLNKAMPPYLMGKDVILDLLGRYGEAGFVYQSLEFYDNDAAVHMDDRFAICNMVVEGGAKNGLFFPDDITRKYITQRRGPDAALWSIPDYKPVYDRTIELDLSAMTPKLAMPSSPANVCDVAAAGHVSIDQVYIGSCTGGRLEDIRAASLILKGKNVAKGMRLLVSPASQAIYKEAIIRGYIQDILDAGGIILNPSCGLCGGIDKGILAAGETCLSTSNRNFQGRMGDPASRAYLSSALTAAAAALTGRIIDPRKVL